LVYSLNKDHIKKIFYNIFLIRSVEKRIAEEYLKQDIRCPVHLSIGQEVVPSVLSLFVNKKDLAVSTHRGHAHYIAKGGNLKKMIAEIYGKKTGCSKGKGGSMHLIDSDVGFYGTSAIVGNSLPVGLGLAYDFKTKNNSNISIVYLGDGALEEGVFYETMNLAATKEIQTLFVCENNLYSVYSPLSVRQPRNRKIIKMVEEIGVSAAMCDGNNIKKVFSVVKNNLHIVRKKKKPFFLLFNTYRHLEHCGPNADNDLGYRPKKEYLKWEKNDPLLNIRKLIKEYNISFNEVSKIEKKIKKIIDKAFIFAKKSNFPEKSQLLKDVYL
jgi:TPP-dependent pyruvate/acetoin dehydrogenase alpha subunit